MGLCSFNQGAMRGGKKPMKLSEGGREWRAGRDTDLPNIEYIVFLTLEMFR